jgi:HEAT repeats
MATSSELVALARELGSAVRGKPENVPDALPRLAEILASETESRVVAEAVNALAQTWGQQAAQLILNHVRVDHPNADVRLAVARALPNGVDGDTHCRDEVIEALVTLSRDESSDVRDWACLGLGQVQASSPAAKDALAGRLTDSDDDTRCEALLALAKTGDPRALAALQQRFSGDDLNLFRLELEAAAEVADPELYPLLVRVSQSWAGDDDDFTPELAFAMSRCHPEARTQALLVERELMARITTLLAAQSLTVTSVGNYPHTTLTFHSTQKPTPTVDLYEIWDDEEDPWAYPLEQTAQRLTRP